MLRVQSARKLDHRAVVRQGETSHGPRAAAPISEMRIGDGVKGDSNCDLPMSGAAIAQAFLVGMMGVRVPGGRGLQLMLRSVALRRPAALGTCSWPTT